MEIESKNGRRKDGTIVEFIEVLPEKMKANGYTISPVACGRTGAVIKAILSWKNAC